MLTEERDHGRPEPGDAALDAVVQTIGRRARQTNLTRAAQLCAALDGARAGDLDPVSRQRAVELAHQLVGSAGTFGFGAASELAGHLETFFATGVFTEPGIAAAHRQLQTLNDVLRGDPQI